LGPLISCVAPGEWSGKARAGRGRLELPLPGAGHEPDPGSPGRRPEGARAIAWKAQLRLCAGFRRLVAAGKNANLVATAVAREMAAFAWAIACQVQPKDAAA
jgi:hypothetical protein